MLQREMERRQQAERDAADARRDSHSTESLRNLQALQISQLNDTVAKMHQELQQYQNSSGDLVSQRSSTALGMGQRLAVSNLFARTLDMGGHWFSCGLSLSATRCPRVLLVHAVR